MIMQFHVHTEYVGTLNKVCPHHTTHFMFPQIMSEHDTKYVHNILGVSCSRKICQNMIQSMSTTYLAFHVPKKNRKVCSAKYVPLQSMLTSLTFYVTAKYVALQTMFHKQHFMSRHKMYMSRHKIPTSDWSLTTACENIYILCCAKYVLT